MNSSATDPEKPAEAAELEAYNAAVSGRDESAEKAPAAAGGNATEPGGSASKPVASNSSNYGTSAVDTSASERT